MEPILDKVRASQNLLERIANAVPGFRGYRDRELRRDADALQREHLAKTLHQSVKPLERAAAAASRSGDLDVVNEIETARKRLDRMIARIRTADRGYSGFFDPVKVTEAELQRVYQFDLDTLAGVESVSKAAGDLSSTSASKTAVLSIVAAVDALDERWNERDAILRAVR